MLLRPYAPADAARLYEICLLTGAYGQSAAHLYQDPQLLGHVYVGPYLALEPEFAFVLDSGGAPVGYVLGALDTRAFAARCESSWWPPLRQRYPDPAAILPERRSPEQHLAALIHSPPEAPAQLTARFPSHLHIDLLPEAQGRGQGRRLITHLLEALAAAGSAGVHLDVALQNQRALGFYRSVDFTEGAPGLFTRALHPAQNTPSP